MDGDPAPRHPDQPERPDQPELPEQDEQAEQGEQAEPRERPDQGRGLAERDRAVLALERRTWASQGLKDRAVREQLDMSPARYYQLLNALLDDQRALEHDPVTVNRLRRLREAQRARR